ncbi:MAG TPA: TolC family protein, partial [Dongiaceae bacterium]
MTKRQHLLLAGAALVLVVHPFGQLASATDLDDALALAYGTNPTIDAERAQVRATDENVPQALSGWRPTVKATAQASQNWVNERKPLNSSSDFSPRSYGLTVTQPIFRGLRTVKGTSQAENQVQAERQRLTSTEQDTLFRAVQAYMGVVRDQS